MNEGMAEDKELAKRHKRDFADRVSMAGPEGLESLNEFRLRKNKLIYR